MNEVIHQTQPSEKTCVQTCLAMALGVPVHQVVARYGENGMNQTDLFRALDECGFRWNLMTFATMVFTGWYFAVVPSLNHRGVLHQVLVHRDEEGGITVLDPAVNNRYARDGSDLRGWTEVMPFIPCGKLP